MSTAAIDQVLDSLERATTAALALARQLAAARGDDDQWTRFPSASARCPISGLSRSALYRLTTAGTVRRKSIGGSAYYSASDVRNHIAQS
jgi:predicted DNA-binding transcriptional regulator AlpA